MCAHAPVRVHYAEYMCVGCMYGSPVSAVHSLCVAVHCVYSALVHTLACTCLCITGTECMFGCPVCPYGSVYVCRGLTEVCLH